jgi:hypothetical protein
VVGPQVGEMNDEPVHRSGRWNGAIAHREEAGVPRRESGAAGEWRMWPG